MGTWVVHLRIADEYIKNNNIPSQYKTQFILGSLSPDCGYGKKDSVGEFTPPPEITHWAPGGIKIYCRYSDFANLYLKDKEHNGDYYFYLGYYIHLITDIIWSGSMYLPTKIKYRDKYKKNPDFLSVIKTDWYDLDFRFLRDNPDFEPYKLLENADTAKDYLPYYEPGQLATQLKFIHDYYKNGTDHELDRDYPFLDEPTMDNFISCAKELIDCNLRQKNLIGKS